MRVLLLYPNLYGMNTIPPAIGLFTAILKRDGHEVKLFDTTAYEGAFSAVDSDKQKSENLNARPFDDTLLKQGARKSNASVDFVEFIRKFQPDLVAMSCTEDMFPVGLELLLALDSNRPKVVAGGVFPTFAPDLVFAYAKGKIDFVLRGEGEDTLPELCRRLELGIALNDLPGLFTNSGRINNPLPKTVDVALLPLPDYSLFEEGRFYRPMQGKLRRMMPIETIRGCPYSCAYCNAPLKEKIYKNESQKFFRKQKFDQIRAEIKHCVDVYKADSIYFWADTFLAWNDREFNEFCEMYSEFGLPFWIQTRPETVKQWKFEKLRDVGLLRVAFGVEHGNEEFRRRILDRNVTNEMILENLKIVTDLGIPISVNNIMGFPTETRKLAFDTIELNQGIRSDGTNAYTFVPYHGTPLRAMSEQLGYVQKGALSRSVTLPTMLNMPQFSKDEIEGIRRCFVLYVKMPKERWPEIRLAESLTPEGDQHFRRLKDECLEKFMHYGDYAKEDDVEKVEFEK